MLIVLVIISSVPSNYHSTTLNTISHKPLSVDNISQYETEFIESGLTGGSLWYLNISRVSFSGPISSNSYNVSLPNGTYSYVSYASEYGEYRNGSFTVSGQAEKISIHFGPSFYSIVFIENGLATGTLWSINFNGTAVSSDLQSITFSELNGTYFYDVGNEQGYISSPSSGTVVVNGKNTTIEIKFQMKYEIEFQESGLPQGSFWYINISRLSYSGAISGSSYTFYVTNGSYFYTVSSSNSNFAPTPSNGSVNVMGSSVNVKIIFLRINQAEYNVTFQENGLPAGLSWDVELNGISINSSYTSITFQEVNGSYNYSVIAPKGFRAVNGYGSLTVNGHPVSININFAEIKYVVYFIEYGLPVGEMWYVSLNNQSLYSNNTTIAFEEVNGTFQFAVGRIPGFESSPESGEITVNGSDVSQAVTFTHAAARNYSVTFAEYGLGKGMTWGVTLNGSEKVTNGTSIIFQEKNGSYEFSVNSIQGYVASPSSGTIEVNGANVSESVTFSYYAKIYTITFKENGLPSGELWYVNVTSPSGVTSENGGIVSSLYFPVTNGTYNFTIGNVSGYKASPSSGELVVKGSNITENIFFTPTTFQMFSITFSESGLLSGTLWSVTINGTEEYSKNSTITFREPNGTYPFTVSPVSGYSVSPSSGSINVKGAAVSENISFQVLSYPVTFSESGLPQGAEWSVTLGNTTKSSFNSSISFDEPDGSYYFTISIFPGYSASPHSGNVTVNGQSLSIAIKFTQILFNIEFEESGLPDGTMWYVNLSSGQSYSSLNDTIIFSEPNGSYTYNIATANRDYSPEHHSGSFAVNGNAVSQSITFLLITYSLTFTEYGLPTGTEWYVNLSNGHPYSSDNNTIIFNESNGSYAYTIASGNSEYIPTHSSGSLVVNGSSVYETIAFKEVVYYIIFNESGLPSGEEWYVNLTNSSGALSASGGIISSLYFSVPNGTYYYNIGTMAGYKAYPSSGKVVVKGSNVNQNIVFTPIKPKLYSITFAESGLPSGTSWSVTLNGSAKISATNTITFSETNGTYSYAIANVSGYSLYPYSGTLRVNGSNVSLAVTYSPITVKTYTVVFTEYGLSSGTLWSVTLNGTSESSSNSTIIFYERNGTYSYSIQGVQGYRVSNYSGYLTIQGNPLDENITWSIILYPITIKENGIPNGTQWSVTLTGTAFNGNKINITLYSTTDTITFNEPNGSYAFRIHLPSGYSSSSINGTVNVSGVNVNARISAEKTPVFNTKIDDYAIIALLIIAIASASLFTFRRRK